jgi:hypothetical protein
MQASATPQTAAFRLARRESCKYANAALPQQLHSPVMRLLSRLEYERSFGATWSTYFVRIPYD